LRERDIVVIGGSAGSIGSLKEILQGLPRHFAGSILVVIHLAEDFPGFLDEHLTRWSKLPTAHPSDGDAIRRGRVYVARPNFHLTIEDGRMRVLRGPRENRHRPAIDPLFRTAARTYGSRVIGIVLSGQDDDGSAGLYAVKQRGGVAIVQDPKDAEFSIMPRHALEYATPHYILRSADIAQTLVKLVHADEDQTVMSTNTPSGQNPKSPKKGSESPSRDVPDANRNNAYSDEGEGTPSVFACPECGGVLWELKDKNLVRFRCRVGHSYGTESLAHELSHSSETALWAAMRALEEKAAMQRRLADGLGENRTAQRMRDQSVADDGNARLIREMIFRGDQELESEPSEPGEAA
jgi:two-component system, chemotaxis family, protein-glutamate methylesterase/glutaminase